MKRRILSFFLASVMVLSMLPLTAFADGEGVPTQQSEGALDPILKDAIYLPVTIRDFYNDGMLFEYQNANSYSTNLWRIYADEYYKKDDGSYARDFVLVNKGAMFEEEGIRSYVSNRFYGPLGTVKKQTTETYNSDGSITLNTFTTADDPYISVQFKGTHAYAYFAAVYKTTEYNANKNLINSGAIRLLYNGTDDSSTYSEDRTVVPCGDWTIVYFKINRGNNGNALFNGVRYDFANGTGNTEGKTLNVQSFFLVNIPERVSAESVSSGAKYELSDYKYDAQLDRLYLPVEATADYHGIYNWAFTPSGDASRYMVLRYRANGNVTARLHDNAGHDATVDLKGDNLWRWAVIDGGTKDSVSNFTLKFKGNATVDLAEVYLLTEEEYNSNFKINQLHSGNIYYTGYGDKTITTVATPYYDDLLAFERENTVAAGAKDTITHDGYYVNYFTQVDDATIQLVNPIHDYTNLDVGGATEEGKCRYVQLRYRANGLNGEKVSFYLTATNSSDYNGNSQVNGITLDDDGKWHTLVIDLGVRLNWYLGIAQILNVPKGASIDVDFFRLFDNVVAAEYFDPNFKAEYNGPYTNTFFSLLKGDPITYTTGSDGNKKPNLYGDVAYGFQFAAGSEAAKIQAALPQLDETTNVINFDGASYITSSTGLKTYETYEGGYWHKGLIEETLENGKPVYKEAVVKAVARVLALSLTIPTENEDGSRNYAALTGTAFDLELVKKFSGKNPEEIFGTIVNGDNTFDLADVLRHNIALNGNSADTYYYTLGDYNATKNAPPVSLADVNDCMDAAYFLLNNIWNDGYGFDTREYTNIALVKRTDASGKDEFIFSSSFANTVYDKEMKMIYNSQLAVDPWMIPEGRTPYSEIRFLTGDLVGFGTTESSYYHTSGNLASPLNGYYRYEGNTTSSSLLDSEYNKTENKDEALIAGDMYNKQNYGYTVEGKGKFVYEKGLFFNFSGDDDVYLFINEKLVLDMGGAHERADLKIDIDKYNETLNAEDKLVEGTEYEFAFFQAERHGFGANFSITTNIPVVNPNIAVDKSAKQNGDSLKDGAKIDPSKEVVYDFYLENTADNDKHLANIVFNDTDISVYFSKDTLTFNNDESGNPLTTLADLTVTIEYYANENDQAKTSKVYTNLTEEQLKEILRGNVLLTAEDYTKDVQDLRGLKFGESIRISGIKYKLTASDIQVGAFPNEVVVQADSIDWLGFGETLVRRDVFTVITSNDQIYLWAGHARTFNISELFVGEMIGAIPFDNFGKTIENKKYDAELISVNKPNGFEVSLKGTNINDQTVTLTVNSNGVYDLLEYKIKATVTDVTDAANPIVESENDFIYDVLVCVYDLKDVSFVLDYGLPVKLDDEKDATGKVGQYLGVTGDVTSLAGNPVKTVYNVGTYVAATASKDASVNGGTISANPTYGDITIDNSNVITYTPTKFIEGKDSIRIGVGVTQGNADYSITKGIAMYKEINFLPASVMYYEESNGSIKTPSGTYFSATSSDLNLTQSADQDLQYGYDAAYNGNISLKGDNAVPSGFWITWHEKQYIMYGSGGLDGFGNTYNFSNNSYFKYDLTKGANSNPYYEAFDAPNGRTNVATSFTFNGTGFELISYTNLHSGSVVVEIYDSANKLVARKAVYTKFTNGELQQIPVIDWKTETYGTYTVYVMPVPVSSDDSPVKNFYIDGVRIFDPIGGNDATLKGYRDTYYNQEENGATFEDIKDVIGNGQAVLTTVTPPANDKASLTTSYATGSTLVEHVGWGAHGIQYGMQPTTTIKTDASNPYTYAQVGPNNELYLMKGNAVTFLLKDTSNSSAKTFQVEAKMFDKQGTLFSYVTKDSATQNAVVGSYTAMYYEVDVANCPTIKVGADTYYIVTIGTTVDEKAYKDYPDGTISITTLKIKGYTLASKEIVESNLTSTTMQITTLSALGEMINESTYTLSGYAAAYNVDLFVKTVTAAPTANAGGTIKFNIVASANAENVYVKGMDGNYIDKLSQTEKKLGDYKIFTVTINAPETAGTYDYAVAVQDSTNRLSEEVRVAAIKVN